MFDFSSIKDDAIVYFAVKAGDTEGVVICDTDCKLPLFTDAYIPMLARRAFGPTRCSSDSMLPLMGPPSPCNFLGIAIVGADMTAPFLIVMAVEGSADERIDSACDELRDEATHLLCERGLRFLQEGFKF